MGLLLQPHFGKNKTKREVKALYKKKNIVFVDFDGTITTEDTLTGAILPFVDHKESFLEYNGKLEKGEMTLSEVVRYAYDDRPAEWIPKMLEYIDTVKIRPGFEEFLDKMAEKRNPRRGHFGRFPAVFIAEAGAIYGQNCSPSYGGDDCGGG